jgi:hypothetical protein
MAPPSPESAKTTRRSGFVDPLEPPRHGGLNSSFRHEEIHQDVVILGIRGRHPQHLVGNGDRYRARDDGGECAVIESPAVTQPITLRTHADNRNDQNLRDYLA